MKPEIKGELNDSERAIVEDYVDNYYPKIERLVNNITGFVIKIKEYKKEGNRKKYSVSAALTIGSRKYEVDYADWQLSVTLKEVFNRLMEKLEHEMHISDKSHAYRKKR